MNPRLRSFLQGFKCGAEENGFTSFSVRRCNANADYHTGYDAATVAKLEAVDAFLVQCELEREHGS